MTALILVDLQNDFMPGGALEVKNGNLILPVVSELLKKPFDFIVATQDFHPKDHVSFASTHKKKPGNVIDSSGTHQILWPDHCIQGTEGAEFTPGFDRSLIQAIFHKGTQKNVDSYSTFFDNAHLHPTGLDAALKERKIHTLYIAGLATDYCVKYSVLDACRLGYKTFVVVDGCQGVNLNPHDSEKALEEMKNAGATLVYLRKL